VTASNTNSSVPEPTIRHLHGRPKTRQRNCSDTCAIMPGDWDDTIAAGHQPKPTCGSPQGPCSAGSSSDRSSAASSTSTSQRLEAADQRPWPSYGTRQAAASPRHRRRRSATHRRSPSPAARHPACPRPVRGRRRAARPRPPAGRRAIAARASRRSPGVCARADAPPRCPQGGAPRSTQAGPRRTGTTRPPPAFARTPIATDQLVITPLAKRGKRPKRHAPHSSGGTRYAGMSGPMVTDQAQRATNPS
jgi:hypothetical protein